MLTQLLDHNDDIKRLVNDGVSLTIVDGSKLVVSCIPYLNEAKELKQGILVMPIETSGYQLLTPKNHTAHWVGDWPCDMNGNQIKGLVNGKEHTSLCRGLYSNYYLSCKPLDRNGNHRNYRDYYDKVITHIRVISGPARALYPHECEKIAKPTILVDNNSPFVYGDTNASRANIDGISDRIAGQKVAIIGMGGTGSYLLDYLAKCPLGEIHIYDDDFFDTHNAFRCPGAPNIRIWDDRPYKVHYLSSIYSNMHKHIIPHCCKVTTDNLDALDEMDFVFICVDTVAARIEISNYLIDKKKSFIDSGLGFNLANERIVGQIRVTTGMNGYYDHLRNSFGGKDADDDLYASNIQIAELNSLAAVLSIIKWKRMMEFYGDSTDIKDIDIAYPIQCNSVIGSKYYVSNESD